MVDAGHASYPHSAPEGLGIKGISSYTQGVGRVAGLFCGGMVVGFPV